MEQTKLELLVSALLESDCKELYVESDFEKVRIVRSYPVAKKAAKKKTSKAQQEKSIVENHEIKSTLVGIFRWNNEYRVGDVVSIGEKIGYLDSLKTKTDVVSDVSGEILEVLVEDGVPVEYGQVLVVVKS